MTVESSNPAMWADRAPRSAPKVVENPWDLVMCWPVNPNAWAWRRSPRSSSSLRPPRTQAVSARRRAWVPTLDRSMWLRRLKRLENATDPSVDLVAYLARYDETFRLSSSVVARSRMLTWEPHEAQMPDGARKVALRTRRRSWVASNSVVSHPGGRSSNAVGPSALSTTWKWTSPRRWNSATFR